MGIATERAAKAGPALAVERHGAVAVLRLDRPKKRNALDDATVQGLHAFFAAVPKDVKAVVLSGTGEHFCAGLDLAELTARSAAEGAIHSQMWHRAFQQIEFGTVPVIAVLHGAVIGGGLELASSAHIRVAERSAFYALPEGQRGIFTGGGGSVRLPRLIGVARMTDMMLTGRVYDAEEGHRIGLSQYLTENGAGLALALDLAQKVASNAAMTNFAVMHALPRIAEMGREEGLFAESLMAGIAQSEPEAKARLQDFLERKRR